jgi:DNA-binding transcriptional MerR regulator
MRRIRIRGIRRLRFIDCLRRQGYTYTEIANRLKLSAQGVNYLHNKFTKTVSKRLTQSALDLASVESKVWKWRKSVPNFWHPWGLQ